MESFLCFQHGSLFIYFISDGDFGVIRHAIKSWFSVILKYIKVIKNSIQDNVILVLII